MVVALEQPEHDGLTRRSTTALAAHAMRAEVRLIHFDIAALEGRLTFTFVSDALADFAKDRNRAAMRKPGQLGYIAGA